MNPMAGKPAVVFDLDGTLLDSGNRILGGDVTISLLKRLQKAGVELAVCTGRLDHDIVSVDERYGLGIRDRISQHGAVIVQGDRCEATLLDKAEVHAAFDYAAGLPLRLEVNTVSNRCWTSERDPDFPRELYDSHIIRADLGALIDYQPVVLFLLVGEGELLGQVERHVNATCSKIRAGMTSRTSLEITPASISKGEALKNLYPGRTIYAIGDSPNDYAMFPVAERSYLVSDWECPYPVHRVPCISDALADIVREVGA